MDSKIEGTLKGIMILILGPHDRHTEALAVQIQTQGHQALFLNSTDFPVNLAFSASLSSEWPDSVKATESQLTIALDQVRAVYWYALSGFSQNLACSMEEAESGFGSILRNLDCHWVNSPDAVALHRYKVHQLKLLQQAGLRVPDTLITNEGAVLRAFYEKHNGQIICKPLYQGLLLHRITEADFTSDALNRLKYSPVVFQEYIPGIDIRVHVIGEETFASEVVSNQFNYKTDFHTRPVSIAQTTQQDCIFAARALGLVLAGVDLRQTPDGEIVFFEANPSPQYMIFEEQCHYPISTQLALNLTQA